MKNLIRGETTEHSCLTGFWQNWMFKGKRADLGERLKNNKWERHVCDCVQAGHQSSELRGMPEVVAV